MKTAYLISRILVWLSIAAFFLALAAFVRRGPVLVAEQAGITRESLDTRIALESYEARLLLDNKSRDLMRRVDTFAAISEQAVRLADIHAGQAIELADRHAAEVQRILNEQLTRTNDSLAEVAKLSQDVQPAIAGANLLMRRDALPAQLLGVTAAAKVTLGQLAKAAISVDQAIPGFLAKADAITENVRLSSINFQDATLAAAKTSADTDLMIQRLTPPYLPKWARLALALSVPVIQGGAAGAAMCVTLGSCRSVVQTAK